MAAVLLLEAQATAHGRAITSTVLLTRSPLCQRDSQVGVKPRKSAVYVAIEVRMGDFQRADVHRPEIEDRFLRF